MVTFPENPANYSEYVADNGVTYMWLGDRWASPQITKNTLAVYIFEGGFSDSLLTTETTVPNMELTGGDSLGLEPTRYVNIDNVTCPSFGYLDVTYTVSGVTGQGFSEMGIIVGTGSVDIERAGEICGSISGTNNAIKYPMREDGGPAYDCNYIVQQNIFDGTFTQELPDYYWNGQEVNVVAYLIKNGETYYSSSRKFSLPYIPCFAAGTQITLADGSTKPIEQITYSDHLRVWDFDLGQLSSALPFWIKKPQKSMLFNRSFYEDGTVLDTMQYVKGHRIFNLTQNKFTFIMDCQQGDEVIKDGAKTKFVSWRIVQEPITYHNIFTNRHMNMYANGILTSTGFNNLYDFHDMKFVKTPRVTRTYANIPDSWVTALRLSENTTTDTDGMARHLEHLEKLRAS